MILLLLIINKFIASLLLIPLITIISIFNFLDSNIAKVIDIINKSWLKPYEIHMVEILYLKNTNNDKYNNLLILSETSILS